jgi:hypothetical protein
MFQHQAETPFHLESLVVVAPVSGYTAPIQEGLIFVGNSPDKLQSAAESYCLKLEGEFVPPQTSPPVQRPRDSEQQLSLLESLNDREIYLASLQNTLSDSLGLPFAGSIDIMSDDDDDTNGASNQDDTQLLLPDNCDWPPLSPVPMPAPARSEFTFAPTPPPFTVTTEESDGASDGDIDADIAMIQDALDINSSRLSRQPRSGRQNVERALNNHFRELLMVRGRARRGRPNRRSSRFEPRRTTASSESVMPPTAVFFTRKDRSKTTIKFNPPV